MRRRLAALPAALLLLSGCGAPSDLGATPDCADDSDVVNPLLVLMAQSVPTAELVPCVRLVPSSWRHGDVDVRRGSATFSFTPSAVDRTGDVALSVRLTRSCDVEGATEVPSDEPGTRRFERLLDVSDGYVGDRYYSYPGGCTTLEFRLSGPDRAQRVGQAALAIGFVHRDTLREGVRERSDGRLRLDAAEPDRTDPEPSDAAP